jgi:hypothetical protein
MPLKKIHLCAAVGLLIAIVIASGFIEGLSVSRPPVVVGATGDVNINVEIRLALFGGWESCIPSTDSISETFSPDQFKTASGIINSVATAVDNVTTYCEMSIAANATYNQDLAQANGMSETQYYETGMWQKLAVDELTAMSVFSGFEQTLTVLKQQVTDWNSSFPGIGGVPESIGVTNYVVQVHLSLDNQMPLAILGATGQLERQKFDVNFSNASCSPRCSLETTVLLPLVPPPLKPMISINIDVPEGWGFPPSLWFRYGTVHTTMNVTLDVTPSSGFVGLAKS